jgi:hypothetical protein
MSAYEGEHTIFGLLKPNFLERMITLLSDAVTRLVRMILAEGQCHHIDLSGLGDQFCFC